MGGILHPLLICIINQLFHKNSFYMFKYIKNKIMSFKNIFKDENSYNEKTIIGFMSFAIMAIFATADIVTGLMGVELVVKEFIYNSFSLITLGSFGIAGLEKFANKKN